MIKTYRAINSAEGYFRCQLQSDVVERIDIPFYSIDKHIAELDPKLSRVLNKEPDWDSWLEFVLWLELDMTPYIESYLIHLKAANGGSLKGLTEEYIAQFDYWVPTDPD